MSNRAPGGRSRQPALIRQHGDSAPPALLAEWAQARGIEIEIDRTDHAPANLPSVENRPFVASLGSKHSPADRDVPAVAGELALIERAVQADVPVLGLCYGGQVLAAVLGGELEHAPEPELGWHRIESEDPELIPEGPWLQWHYDRVTLPPGARELARSPRALQAFTQGPHVGVQFHPESTIEIVQGWARSDRERLRGLGIEDGETLAETGRRFAAAAREAAFTLFDAFWRRAHRTERSAP